MSADKILALVHYYAREGYARQVQTVCSEVLKKRANDPTLVFWRAYGYLMEGSASEVREVTNSLMHGSVSLQTCSFCSTPEAETATWCMVVKAHTYRPLTKLLACQSES